MADLWERPGRNAPLAQVNRQNFSELKIAWTYRTSDVADGTKTKMKSAFEAIPIVVDGTMYFSTPFNRVVALDPGSGTKRGIFDPKDPARPTANLQDRISLI